MPLKDMVIDLSHWNTVTDVEEIKASGIVGVIFKASEGTSYRDEDYAKARSVCDEHGLLFGAYHFLRPGKIKEQSEWFVDVAGADIDLYAADHEDDGVSLDDLKEFLGHVERLTGRIPIIYSGHVLKNQMNGNEYDPYLARHRLWLAQYTTGTPDWPKSTWPKWWLWQHSDEGSVPGIDGDCDVNYYDGSPEKLADEWMSIPGEPFPDEEEGEITIRVIVPQGVKVVVEEE